MDISKGDCIAILDLIHYCTRLDDVRSETDAIFKKIADLIPTDTAIIGIGTVADAKIKTIDALYSYGPNSWLSEYQENNLVNVDPIVKKALCSDSPFSWGDAYKSYACDRDDYVELKQNLARREGIVGACRGRGRNTAMTLVSMSIHEANMSKRHLDVVEYLLPHIHDLFLRAPVNQDVNLTPREREILNWVKDGKSAWVIGQLLSISERTVKFHLSNVFSKLNVASRAQAVAKAIRLGLIEL